MALHVQYMSKNKMDFTSDSCTPGGGGGWVGEGGGHVYNKFRYHENPATTNEFLFFSERNSSQ